MNRRVETASCVSFSLVASLSFVLLVHAPAAQALSVTFDLDSEFSGATAPAGPGPWLRITFDDSIPVAANTVRLTIAAVGLTGIESANSVLLNFDPGLNPTQLGFTAIDASAAPPNAINTGTDAYMADGDGRFDIEFDLAPPGKNANRLTSGESISFDVTHVSPITAASFDFFSTMTGGAGPFQAAAQIQRIGVGGESGWIAPLPEPSTGLLLGLGLVVASRRRARR